MKQHTDPKTAFSKTCRYSTSPDRTSAVSESVGAILLVSMVVLFIAVIAGFLLSMQTPGKVPNLNFMAGTNEGQTVLYLYP